MLSLTREVAWISDPAWDDEDDLDLDLDDDLDDEPASAPRGEVCGGVTNWDGFDLEALEATSDSVHLGSASLEIDQTGRIISYEEYYPYGGTSFIAGGSTKEVKLKEYRYTGKERDDTSGFYYHGARYFAPWTGRWMSADPAGPVDGLNLYEYVSGNPVRMVDPEGMQEETPQGHREWVDPGTGQQHMEFWFEGQAYKTTESYVDPVEEIFREETSGEPSAVLLEESGTGEMAPPAADQGEITIDPLTTEAEEYSRLAVNPEKAKRAYIEWGYAQAKAKEYWQAGQPEAALEWGVRSVLSHPGLGMIPSGGGMKIVGKAPALGKAATGAAGRVPATRAPTPAGRPTPPGAAGGAGSRATTGFVSDATVVSRGKVMGRGTVDVRSTVEGIQSGKLSPRAIFENREGLLPKQGAGYYQEFVHPTPGVSGVGPQRIVAGKGGELFYTPDHYKTFIPLNRGGAR